MRVKIDNKGRNRQIIRVEIDMRVKQIMRIEIDNEDRNIYEDKNG